MPIFALSNRKFIMAGKDKNRREIRINPKDYVQIEHTDTAWQNLEIGMFLMLIGAEDDPRKLEILELQLLDVQAGKSVTQVSAGIKPFTPNDDINKPYAVALRGEDGVSVKFLHFHPQRGLAFGVKESMYFDHVQLNTKEEAARIMFDIRNQNPEMEIRVYLYNVYTGIETWWLKRN